MAGIAQGYFRERSVDDNLNESAKGHPAQGHASSVTGTSTYFKTTPKTCRACLAI